MVNDIEVDMDRGNGNIGLLIRIWMIPPVYIRQWFKFGFAVAVIDPAIKLASLVALA
jgi:hypothetical protein